MPKKTSTSCHFQREPLASPLGFKGHYLTELWQVAAKMETATGLKGIGLGVQSVLWCDSEVFKSRSEATSNLEMFEVTCFALQQAKQIEWNTPIDLLEQLLCPTYQFAKTLTGKSDLRLTYALNALVAIDQAAWLLYAQEHHLADFDNMIPVEYRTALSSRQNKLACIPLIGYGTPINQVESILGQGLFFLKIKIGSDPDQDGCQDKMLEWDQQRLSTIHDLVKDHKIPHTENNSIPYYLDANGRYKNKDHLMRFLDHAEKIGALERILLLEEPFPESYKESVHDIPIRLVADESAHTEKDTLERIDLGYRAIALKPIAKTLSMTLKIAKVAHDRKIPCFCADLTVNPVMVDWNKNLAAHLKPLPGMKMGVLETNGHQNYKNWEKMISCHPCAGAKWITPKEGCFNLNDDFYRHSGGIFKTSEYYETLSNKQV